METNKVKSLEVENFKRIEFVSIQPAGHSVIIKGNNGAGKSSLTDGLVATLAGKRFFPNRPIRDGETHAHVEATIGNFVIRRDWNLKNGEVKEKTSLRYDDGRPITSPQAFLDRMFGGTKFANFDPSEFIRDEKSQRAVLLKMIGVDDLLEEIKRDYTLIFSKRQDINRKIRDQKGIIQEINVPGDDIPTKLISAGDLSKKISEATKTNSANAEKRNNLSIKRTAFDTIKNDIDDLLVKLAGLRDSQSNLAVGIEELEAQTEGLKDVDTEKMLADLEVIEEKNEAITQANEKRRIRKAAETEGEERQKQSDQYTKQLEELLYKKTDALKKAQFPVAGLSVDDDNILFNGMPITQESDSKRLQIAMQIAIAKIPKDGIRIIRMKDASMLDKNAMAEVERIAVKHDVQVFLEVVGEKGPGILVENGLIVRDIPPRGIDKQ